MPRAVDPKEHLTIYFGDLEVFSREVSSFACEETIDGKFTAEANFAPTKVDWSADGRS